MSARVELSRVDRSRIWTYSSSLRTLLLLLTALARVSSHVELCAADLSDQLPYLPRLLRIIIHYLQRSRFDQELFVCLFL